MISGSNPVGIRPTFSAGKWLLPVTLHLGAKGGPELWGPGKVQWCQSLLYLL
jgi:hypothetical protein